MNLKHLNHFQFDFNYFEQLKKFGSFKIFMEEIQNICF